MGKYKSLVIITILITITFLFILILFVRKRKAPKISISPLEQASVVRVIDGDTIEVDLNGEKRMVRYLGIDAPEKNECFYNESTEKNREFLEGKIIELRPDGESEDIFGRLLRYIYADEIFVNETLVKEGYARVFDFDDDLKYQKKLNIAEQNAREGNKGLWGVCEVD